MKNALIALIGTAALVAGMSAIADEPMMATDQMLAANSMDTKGDGKITKEEYMAYYERMWRNMKKDASGRVDAKIVMMQHDAMSTDQGMSKDAESR
jgi:hypothetical protein